MKVLNLYAGIGGNRKLWTDVEVTAVELNPDIAAIYKDFFPNDNVIIGDAHSYLLEHFAEYDFIWSSPPCPSHGQYRYNVGVRAKGYKGIYPDMKLYEEIIFLQYHSRSGWIVENTISYYKPLVIPQRIGRHYIWSNCEILSMIIPAADIRSKNKISDYVKLFDLSKYKIANKRQILRNCTEPELGLHIFNEAKKGKQIGLF